jgi:adenylate cyclase
VTDGPQEGESSSVWNRLRRRKVAQWGLAYAAGAWGFQQGVAYVSTLVDWSLQVQRLTGLALLLGLPVAVTLAWYHGDRGQQRIKRTELAILTLLFLLGGGLFWYYQRTSIAPAGRVQAQSAPPSASTPAALPNDRSIAVLPFVNMSPDKEQEYFADGISEELLNLLAQVPQLRVIARTSSFSFKGKEADIATIARTLNVANVLEGSVRKSGDTLRITAQLVRASDSSHLWSQAYDRQLSDVFAVQDEIAAAVVNELKIRLLGAAPRALPRNPEAYALFLQAREFGLQFTSAALDRSIALYEQVLALEPDYAAAWVGLAGVHSDQVNTYLRPADEGIQLSRAATEKALALSPDSAPALAQIAWISIYYDRDLAMAAQYLHRALAIEPANPDIIGTAAVLARRLGRMDQAIALSRMQVSRDPVNSDAHYELGVAYRYAGRLDEAIAAFRTTLSLSPDSVGAHATIADLLLQKGDGAAALAEASLETDAAWRLPSQSMAYHALGRNAESDVALATLVESYSKANAEGIAAALAFRGATDRSFEWLERAAKLRDPALGAAPFETAFAGLHSDPRWHSFLRANGLAPEQLAAIEFDVKLPD